MPDCLELEEGRDVVGALPIGLSPNDTLYVLRTEALELRGIAVGAGEIERGDVHVRCEDRRELLPETGEDVHDSGRDIGGRKALREFDRDKRMLLGRDDDRGVATDADREEARRRDR